MIFSTPVFIFYFFPIVLLAYFLFRRWRNPLLLLASLISYAWGEGRYFLILIFSMFMNYAFALFLDRRERADHRKLILAAAVAGNLLLLAYFKYYSFFMEELNWLLVEMGLGRLEVTPVHLPLGISFFTFQAMTYVIDVYRGIVRAERNPATVGLYITMFPQLIAGPIVRFREIVEQLHHRVVTMPGFSLGVQRFITGLAQKLLIADTLAVPVDAIFAMPPEGLTAAHAWLGVTAFGLQIYYDFAGYSNMAIGMGHMLGFEFPENFNYPYISQSFTEFWRRWHMTLSRWFRDYLYIPLGGNRRGEARTYANLWIVFVLCGLWHGANWTFVAWGIYHGLFLVIERAGFGRLLERMWRPMRHAYLLLFVLISWAIFRCASIAQFIEFVKAMAGLSPASVRVMPAAVLLDVQVIMALAAGAILSTPLLRRAASLWEKLEPGLKGRLIPALVEAGYQAAYIAVFVICCSDMAASTSKPFIYFRF